MQDGKNYLLAKFMQSKPTGRGFSDITFYSDPGYHRKNYSSYPVTFKQSSRPTTSIRVQDIRTFSPGSSNETVINTRSSSENKNYFQSNPISRKYYPKTCAKMKMNKTIRNKDETHRTGPVFISVDVKDIETENNHNELNTNITENLITTCVLSVLDGKTVRIRNADNQYLTGYQHSDHINPKYRFTDRVNEDSDQLFTIETVRGNSCVLVSVLKHVGYIKPALFYSPLTKDLQLRDYYPYCPKERKYFTAGGNSSQSKNSQV